MPPQQQGAAPQQKRRRRRRRPGDEEEPVLRTTCDACTQAKVKCNGEKPCTRCGNKNIQCEYTFKKRCGPKRRKGIPGDGGGLLAPYADANGAGGSKVIGFGDHLRGESTPLNKDEVECVDVFMQNVNSFLPLTTYDTIKRAATGGGDGVGDGSGGDGGSGGGVETQYEDRTQILHARKAMLHGAIALGAEFLDKEEVSIAHAGIARQEIKECFDAAVPELVAAHVILALYWTHQMDSSKINRCIGLAHSSNGIIGDPPTALAASLTFVSVVLFDAKVMSSIGCRVDPPSAKTGLSSSNNPAACQERILNILSFVLLAIHNRSASSTSRDTGMGATGEWDPKAMTEYVYEARALLDKGSAGGGRNDITKCIIVVLQAYFLLLTDNRRQAIVITEPLADLVADNPLVLHLPVVWSMVGCVRVLLQGAGRQIAVERLESLLAAHGFSTDASYVEQELMSVFSGKPVPTRRRGATTAPSAAGAAAAAAAAAAVAQDMPMSRHDLMRHSRAQTSSLNVTARDYVHRGRNQMPTVLGMSDLDAYPEPEPSPAPQQRALPSSSSRQGAPRGGGGGGGGGGGASQSRIGLLSAAMISSGGEPILASSPPPFRAGALTRAPAARGSLSIPLVSVKQPALPIDLPFMDFPPGSKEELVEGKAGGVGVGGGGGGGGEPSSAEGVEALEEAAAAGGSKIEGARGQLMRKQRAEASFVADAPVSDLDLVDEDGRQQSFKADAPCELDDGVKLGGPGEDRSDLMSKQQVQASFVADAPVSLEQVESNMAALQQQQHQDEVSVVSRLVDSIDLDAAAELIATKTAKFP